MAVKNGAAHEINLKVHVIVRGLQAIKDRAMIMQVGGGVWRVKDGLLEQRVERSDASSTVQQFAPTAVTVRNGGRRVRREAGDELLQR